MKSEAVEISETLRVYSPSQEVSHEKHSPSQEVSHEKLCFKSVLEKSDVYTDFWCTLSEYLKVFPQDATPQWVRRNIKNGKLPPYVVAVRKVIGKGCIDSYILKVHPIAAIEAYNVLRKGGDNSEIRIKIPGSMRRVAELILDVNKPAFEKFCNYVKNNTIHIDTSFIKDGDDFFYMIVHMDKQVIEKIKRESDVTCMSLGKILTFYLHSFWLTIPESTRDKYV